MLGRDIAEVRAEGLTSFDRRQRIGNEVLLEASGLDRRHQLHDVSLDRASGRRASASPACSAPAAPKRSRRSSAPSVSTAARVAVAGRRVRTGSPRASLAAGTVLLPEDRKAEGIVPTMSVRDNIALMAIRPGQPVRIRPAAAVSTGSSTSSSPGSASRPPVAARTSASSRAATSRRRSSPGSCAPTRRSCCSTSRPAASTSGPRRRCSHSSNNSPTRVAGSC